MTHVKPHLVGSCCTCFCEECYVEDGGQCLCPACYCATEPDPDACDPDCQCEEELGQ